MNPFKVEQIRIQDKDSTGAEIETVYAKVVPQYAVYRTGERVMVQYADDDRLGSEQRRALIESNPLKGEINGLIDGWRKSEKAAQATRARLFDRRTADALVVALQGDQRSAVDLLTAIKADILAERTSIARTSYLFTACAVCVIVALLFGWIYHRSNAGPPDFARDLSLSVVVGALGAFFSIALAIRGRQIATDLQWRDNHADAALRVLIGAISGAVLFCLLQAKVVALSLQINDGAGEDARFAFLVVAAFVAGFTERLVGDLLGRVGLTPGKPGANPLAGSSAPTKVAASESKATETNPLGDRRPPSASTDLRKGLLEEPSHDLEDAKDFGDGCLDHVALTPHDMTEDVELPPATGGIVGRP